MNRRIRRASAGGRHARAWWLTQERLRRCVRRTTRAIADQLVPVINAIAADILEWVQEPGQ